MAAGATGEGMMIASFPALVSVLALLLYVAVFIAAGQARRRYDIKAPAVTGAPQFERAFRVQQNTLEQLVWFIPALWLFALYVSPSWGGIIGLVWIAGRGYYALSYYRDPETRGPGFAVGLVSSAILLVGALIGTLAAL
jgi:glutathione S-transferase